MSTSGGSQQPPYGQYGQYGQSQGQQGGYGQYIQTQSAQGQQPAYPGGPDPYGYLHNSGPHPSQSNPQSYQQPHGQGQAQGYYQGPPIDFHQGPPTNCYQIPPPDSQSYQQAPTYGYGYAPPQDYQQYPAQDPSQSLAQGLAQVSLGPEGRGSKVRKPSVIQSGVSGPSMDDEHSQGAIPNTGEGTDRGLVGDITKKLKKSTRKKHQSDDESESDNTPSSSSSDSDDSGKKKKKKSSKSKPSGKSKPKYFFSYIADKNNTICFSVKCRDDGSDNLVLDSNEHEIAYKILFGDNDFTGEIYREGLFAKTSDERIRVGAWTQHVWHTEKLKFVFPATSLRDKKDKQKWGFDPDYQEFCSDIGFLGNDVFMKWSFSKKAPKGGYKCEFQCDRVDGNGNGAIVWVVVDSYYEAKIHTNAAFYKNQEELDEMMVIVFAVFDRVRDECFLTAYMEDIKDKHYKDIKNRRKLQNRGN